ncbi:hypothetical protein SAMN05192574_105282 [Mucilaginibacter gossypiicola]|uniref:Uncharacterized protein n=1 Tax=Mucilaginibacter gossypiicola TaxID=551995 RepID=A0A1H8LWN8_9SPHI|nr:hypothetical protein [Mucilaginibacter gossypiicola]SEO09499.1 hypothetical protein SAMN05192574_105282 [Mucilaginibacter gossypiicola]
MEQSKLDIEDGHYGGKLNLQLWKLKSDPSHKESFIELFQSIVDLNLLDITLEFLKEHFNEKLNDIVELDVPKLGDNKELLARCLDIKILVHSSNIKKHLKTAVNNYWDVFLATGHHEYLVRYLGLIRLAKAMFASQIDEIYERIKEIVIPLPSMYWQLQIIKQMPAVFGKENCQELLGAQIEQKIIDLKKSLDFNAARLCVQSLRALELISDDVSNIEQALLFEYEADLIVSEKQPNTFYPTISQKYTIALEQVFNVPNSQEIKNRIILKLQEAQLEDSKMINAVGISMGATIDYKGIQETINSLNLTSFYDAFQTLLMLPILPKQPIDETAAIEDEKESPIAKAFSKHVKLSGKGKPIGFGEEKKPKRTCSERAIVIF